MERKAARSSQKLTNEFLQESKLDEFEAVAVKEELASQVAQPMQAQNLSRKRRRARRAPR